MQRSQMLLNLTRAEFRRYAQQVITIGGFVTAFTPNKKDDQVVQLLSAVLNDEDDFDAICGILGIPPDPVI